MSGRIPVLVDPDDIQSPKADDRGRVNLGSEYAGEELTVAIVGVDAGGDADDRAECPNGCGPLVARTTEEFADSLCKVECPDCGYVGGTIA